MMLRRLLAALILCLAPSAAFAVTCPSFSYTLTNGQTADANQVMANFNTLLTCNNTLLAPIASPTFTGTVTLPDGSSWSGAGLVLAAPIASPVFSGTITGTYTIGGSVTISSPIFSGTATGTYVLAGTPTIDTPTIMAATITGNTTLPDGGSMAAGGTVLGSATGGAQGAGTLNATGLYVNGGAVGVVQSQIAGLLPSSITGTNTTASMTISVGAAADSTAVAILKLASPASWAITNGDAANGYQGGTTLPDSTTIHFFLCYGTSGTATFASTSESSPTCPTGYTTYFRRIFSLLTNGSGAFIANSATVNEWSGGSYWLEYNLIQQDVDTPETAVGTLYALSVPQGIKVQPIQRAGGTGHAAQVQGPDEPNSATPSGTSFVTPPGYDSSSSNTGQADSIFRPILTNTSGQVRIRANTSGDTMVFYTLGYIDARRN